MSIPDDTRRPMTLAEASIALSALMGMLRSEARIIVTDADTDLLQALEIAQAALIETAARNTAKE